MGSDTPRMPPSYDTDISREPDSDVTGQAEQLGAEAGRNAAGGVFDGNTDAETYRRTLAGLDAGDPLIMDSLTPPSCDQEDLAAELGFDDWPRLSEGDAAELDDAGNAWNDAADSAFYAEVERIAREHVKPHGLDMARAYVVAGSRGVAWRIVSDDAVDGMVTAVMIGDDREEDVDLSDLTPISDDDFCGGCGQIGCEGDGRHSWRARDRAGIPATVRAVQRPLGD